MQETIDQLDARLAELKERNAELRGAIVKGYETRTDVSTLTAERAAVDGEIANITEEVADLKQKLVEQRRTEGLEAAPK